MPDFSTKIGRIVYSTIVGLCAVICFIAAIIFIWSVGPSIEKQWQPVVGKLQVIDKVEIEPGVVEIHARFQKIRNCEYVSVAWYVGTPNSDFRQVRVQTIVNTDMLTEDRSPTRPVGTSIAGPWRIGMSMEDFDNNSFAILTHRCHPFWTTTTQFWP